MNIRCRPLKNMLRGAIFCVMIYFAVSVLSAIQATIKVQLRRGTDTRYPYQEFVKHEIKLAEQEPQQYYNRQLPEDVLIEEMQKALPNLPVTFWYKNKDKDMQYNDSCARFPNLLDVEYNNKYWQTYRTSPDTTFHLYAAYFDNRKHNKLGPTIRILSLMNRRNTTAKTYCQFWFDDMIQPVTVKSMEYRFVWFLDWGYALPGTFEPYLVACVLPNGTEKKIPQSVSLVEKPCDNAKNHLKVLYSKPRVKKNFAVCVKGLDFLEADLSIKLTEWIELTHILGADKIFIYQLNIHPNVSKVLSYYEEQGTIEVTPITLGGIVPNAPLLQHFYLRKHVNDKRQQELIPYNDCFYRHMYEYKYITLLDIDEIIMPIKYNNWTELMDNVLPVATKTLKKTPNNIYVQNTMFIDSMLDKHGLFPDIPSYMHMMQHVYRTKSFSKPGSYAKAFFDTERILSLHNHHPIECLEECKGYNIKPDMAQLSHYRSSCYSTTKRECEELLRKTVKDLSVWKFRDPLVSRVKTTLEKLGLV